MTPLALRAGLFATVSVATLALLVGCTPAPLPAVSEAPSSTPEASAASVEPTAPPTRPALGDLTLSTEGLGRLVLGQAPETDPALSMVTFDPVGCTDDATGYGFGIVAGDPLAGGWFIDPSYEVPPSPNDSGEPFGVAVDTSGALSRIDLYTDDIATDAGVRLGDTRADVVAAYPSALVINEFLTDIYAVSSPTGILQIEVAARDTPEQDDYWAASGIPEGQVLYIHAVAPSQGVFTVAASGNAVGGCNFG